MGTDKTHVGFVSENRHDFVGFVGFFPTDKNRHRYFKKPTPVSVFCRFGVGLSLEIFFLEIFFSRDFGHE